MPPSHDFMGSFFKADIVTDKGDRFPLWMRGPEDNGPYKDLPHMACVDEVSVTYALAQIPVMKVSMTMPWSFGRPFLNSALVEYGQNSLELQYGFVGEGGSIIQSELVKGILLKPDLSLGFNDLKLTLNAVGMSGFGPLRSFNTVPCGTLTRLAAMQLAATGGPQGKIPLEIDTSLIEKGSKPRSKLDESVDFNQGVRSDFKVITDLASECFCYARLDNDKVVLLPFDLVLVGSSEQLRTFILYDFPGGQFGPAQNTYPILNISSESQITLPGYSGGYAVTDVDSKKVKQFMQLVDQKTTKAQSSGSTDGGRTASTKGTQVDSASGAGLPQKPGDPGSTKDMDDVAVQVAMNTVLAGIKLTIETVGIPDLLPGETVALLTGIDRLGIKYGIQSVTHSITASGYGISFDAISNVGDLFAAPEAVNPSKDPEPVPANSYNDGPPVVASPVLEVLA